MGGLLQINYSYTKDEAEIPSFSRRDLYLIFVVGLVSASLALFLANPVSQSFDLAILLNSVNILSMAFATGLFSFLTAGLLFSSPASRLYLLRRMNEVGAKRTFGIRVLDTIVITSFFTVFLTIIAFLKPIILDHHPMSFSHFAFFPSVLGASLIGSVSLALIASSLASIIDDSRLCVVLGSSSTTVIAAIAGWNSDLNVVQYSLNRNIALLSPHNIVRALAVQLSGFQFESSYDMVRQVGFTVSAEGLAVALLILSSISIVLLIAGQRILVKNSTRWTILEGMIPTHKIWSISASAEKLQEITRVRRGLRLQRGLTTLIVGTLLVSVMLGGSISSTYLANITRTFHHVSPEGGERVLVGSWNIYDVDVIPPYPGLFNMLHFYCDIENWGNASNSLSVYYGILEMNSTEFDLLEESSRFELVFSRLNQTRESGGGYGAGKNLEESYGSYLCVLKIVSDVDPSEKSYVEAELLIVQEGL